jgi:hypothetical protein
VIDPLEQIIDVAIHADAVRIVDVAGAERLGRKDGAGELEMGE